MVLISIHPFAFRKIFLIVAALLCFSAFCFADPVFMAERYMPSAGLTGTAAHPANQAELGLLQPVDLPSRDQKLLLGVGRGDETFSQGDPEDLLQQTA